VSAPVFHRLTVSDVTAETDDSVAVTFAVPSELAGDFAYLPGQHVTVRAIIDGEDVRRSYSICADASTSVLRVGIKQLPGGAFSTWATTDLRVGDELEVMPPVGEFTITPDPSRARHYGAIAAGSGITPVLSLVATVLAVEPESRFSVVYGNRGASSIMFLDELDGLKNRHPGRLHLVHVLSRETGIVPLLSGRLDAPKLEELLDRVIDANTVDEWFLCGPFEMVATARAMLEARGVEPELVHDELFFAGPLDPATLPPPPAHAAGTVALSFVLEGRRSEVRMLPETSVLDAALSVRHELPYSCKGGMCASCKARLIDGTVEMAKNYALVDADLDAGFILTCQSHPTSDRVEVDYDQR
jgi:ring-1,2-phenylacetyl-CoA epoxidase subunit PaaE